jgi:hypothetical protein
MNSELITNLRIFHCDFKILGNPQRSLLDTPQPLFVYLLSILRDDNPLPCPDASEPEWAFFITELSMHGLIPLLYFKISQLPEHCHPPKEIKRKFKEAFLKNNLACQMYLKQLKEVLETLCRKDVDVIVLKGLALAWSVYPHFAARPFGDIDLLTKSEQFLHARKSLLEIGYSIKFKRYEIYKDICKAEEFFHKTDRRKPLALDLHWNLFHHFGIDRNGWTIDVFRQKEPVKVPGISFFTLDPVDAFIHSAVHLTLNHDEGIRLIWITDLAYLTRKLNEIDGWPILCRKLVKLKTGLAVQYAVQAAKYWSNAQVPDHFLRFLENYRSDKAERLEMDYVVKSKTANIKFGGYIKTIKKASNKSRYLMQLIFPDPVYVRIAYPPQKSWLLPLSYLKRWGFWFKELSHYTRHRIIKRMFERLPK